MSTLGLKLPPTRRDLTGQRFNMLVAVRSLPKPIRNCAAWECLCDCGNTTVVISTRLIRSVTKSCGCLKIKYSVKQMVGKRFGRVVVVKQSQATRKGRMWECLCDCGNVCFEDTAHLNNGHRQSCGCLRKERAKAAQQAKLIDRTGMQFGRLTVIERVKRNGSRNYVRCVCACGNTTVVWVSSLTGGYTRSCGCVSKAHAISRHTTMTPEVIPDSVIAVTTLYHNIKKAIKRRR